MSDQIPHLASRQVYSEVHVSKEALVIMETLLLGETETELVEGVVVDLAHVLKSLAHLVLACLHMHIYKRKRRVVQVEPDGHRALVACHAAQTSLDLELLDVFNPPLKVTAAKQHYVLADHGLLGNGKVRLTECILHDLLPQLGSLLVLANYHFFGVERHHLLQAEDVNV